MQEKKREKKRIAELIELPYLVQMKVLLRKGSDRASWLIGRETAVGVAGVGWGGGLELADGLDWVIVSVMDARVVSCFTVYNIPPICNAVKVPESSNVDPPMPWVYPLLCSYAAKEVAVAV